MFQSKSSILLLVATIVSSSFLFVHGDILDILQSNIDDIVEVLDQQTRSSAQNRDQNVSGNYNDTKCREDIRVLMKALNNTEMWAIKVADAWGKLPSGVLSGNLMEQGDFDQCLSSAEKDKFEPQYCMGVVKKDIKDMIGKQKNEARYFHHQRQDQNFATSIHRTINLFANDRKVDVRMGPTGDVTKIGMSRGVCVPNSCTPVQIERFVQAVLKQIVKEKDVEFEVVPNSCVTNDPNPFSVGDICALVLVGFFVLLTAASTFYDYYWTRHGKTTVELYTTFSVYTNLPKIFAISRNKSPDMFECLNGIRVLSAIWVIYGHAFVLSIATPMSNVATLLTWIGTWFSMTLILAPLSVDTFLFMGGFLIGWNLLKKLTANNGRINVPLLWVHRYIRLTPILAVGILLTTTILTKYGNGPGWNYLFDNTNNVCETTWWRALLYIQNYWNDNGNQCFVHSWYLSVDFQMFLISPLLVFLLYRFGYRAFPVLVLLILLSAGSIVFILVHNGYTMKYLDLTNNIGEAMRLTYFPTHTRMTPWIIGIMFAYILHRQKDKRVNFNIVHAISSYTLMFILFGVCAWYTFMYQQSDHVTNSYESGLYLVVTRTAWPTALALLVLICIRGYGGPINRILSAPVWQPFCRLSYSIYIVHMPIVLITTASARRSFHFTNEAVVLKYIALLIVSFGVCVLSTLLFESPIMRLEKYVFGGPRKPSQNKEALSPSAPSQQDLVHSRSA